MSKLPILKNLKELIVEDQRIGSIVDLDYDNAVVVTTDFYQELVGGVPRNSFLTAVAPNADGSITEVVLMAVVAPTPLSITREFLPVREELAVSAAVTGEARELDKNTEASMATIGFSARVLGTFYIAESGAIRFGADITRIRANSLLTVYRPRGRALSLIGSFSNANSIDDAGFLEVGRIRYTEADPSPDHDAAMFINVKDFIGKKTALFGMTRSGKSNSIKTITQKIHFYSKRAGKPVAQLILDPQGEYSNTNSQDGEALANIGDESEIAIYKIMDKSMSPKEKYLQFDLFLDENLALTWELILAELNAGMSAGANYIAPLFNIDFEPLGENATMAERHHWRRKKLGLYALMYEGVGNHPVKHLYVAVGEELASEWSSSLGLKISTNNPGELIITNTSEAHAVSLKLLKEKTLGDESSLSQSWKTELEEGEAGKLIDQIENIREKGRNGVKASVARIQDLHSSQAVGDVRENVWEDIQAGKLIMVDLSRGSTKTSQVLSELIVNHLLNRASERFIGGLEPVPFQIIVEEAHNLFERDAKKNERDPWVRISKEASKYHIGLLYATQEVTSVDKRILSNTSNWVIAHLSSTIEVGELAKYYQFADWGDSLRRVETKGFVRMKTESAPYITPVQLQKFQAYTGDQAPALREPANLSPAPDANAAFEF